LIPHIYIFYLTLGAEMNTPTNSTETAVGNMDLPSTVVTNVLNSALVSVSTRVNFVNDVVSTAVSRVCDSGGKSESNLVTVTSSGDRNCRAMKTVSSMVRGLDADIQDLCDGEESNEFLNLSEGIDRDIDKLVGIESNVEDWDNDAGAGNLPVESPDPVGSGYSLT